MMRTIGLIGGMSWESSREYYGIINRAVRQRCGGLHSAPLVMWSLDFAPVEELQRANRWNEAARVLQAAARSLTAAGAECLLICTNTMHKVADAVAEVVDIPLLHIADATAAAVRFRGLRRVGLLGTRFTMEEEFYRARLGRQGDLEVMIPEPEERRLIDEIIFKELCLGRVEAHSRRRYRQIIAKLVERGAEGILLGCTEIGLLIKADDARVPLFDSTRIHALAAVDWALAG
jgi:aspartate racemase